SAATCVERCEVDLPLAAPRELFRTVLVSASREPGHPPAAGAERAGDGARTTISAALREHERAWAERWHHADVAIAGAPGIERALRFALYHLVSAASPDDPTTSIGARALTGEAYRGHVFWDTEIFMLPFFVHTWPEAARSLLLYRHVTIDGAR